MTINPNTISPNTINPNIITTDTTTTNTINPIHRTSVAPSKRARRTSSSRSIARLVGSTAAALALLGSVPTIASAQADSFVACIPSEFAPCPGAVDPEEPNPFVVVDGLVFCGLIEGQNPCPEEPDPGPSTPFEGPDGLVFCGLDMEGQNPCDDEDPDPGTPFTGPGDLVSCGLDEEGQNPCPSGEDGEDGESGEDGEGGEGGIDVPVGGDPDFTG